MGPTTRPIRNRLPVRHQCQRHLSAPFAATPHRVRQALIRQAGFRAVRRSRGRLMVLGHLGVNVPDLAAAKAYYDQVMPALAYEQFLAAPDEFAYQPAEGKRGTYVFF